MAGVEVAGGAVLKDAKEGDPAPGMPNSALLPL